MNRRTAASLMTIGCLTLQACELGPDYPGPNRSLRTETGSYCANTDEEQSQYLVRIESGGAPGLNLRGEVGIFVERTRSYDTDPLVVVAACPGDIVNCCGTRIVASHDQAASSSVRSC